MKKITFLIASLIVLCTLCSCGHNPHNSSDLTNDMHESLNTVKRVDDVGKLYEMDVKFDYESSDFNKLLENNKLTKTKPGCTTFMTHNENNDVVSCRNFDTNHKANKSEIEDGIFVVYHCHNEGSYKSISIADIKYLNDENEKYKLGALDDGNTDTSNIVLSIYDPLDGLNEKGLSVFSLSSDITQGETPYTGVNPNLESCTIGVLMRHILDKCATVEEACELAKQYNVFGYYDAPVPNHLFISDNSGVSKAIEWRGNEMRIVDSNVSTNFYLAWDDKYGHGQDRYNIATETLKQKTNKEIIKNLLSAVAQHPKTEKSSLTQYSAFYNNQKLTLDIWMSRDYSKKYSFNII